MLPGNVCENRSNVGKNTHRNRLKSSKGLQKWKKIKVKRGENRTLHIMQKIKNFFFTVAALYKLPRFSKKFPFLPREREVCVFSLFHKTPIHTQILGRKVLRITLPT